MRQTGKTKKSQNKDRFGLKLLINFGESLIIGLLFYLILKGAQHLVESNVSIYNQWTFLFLQMPAWFFAILAGLFFFLWKSFKNGFIRFALGTCSTLFVIMLATFAGESWQQSLNIVKEPPVSDSFNTETVQSEENDSSTNSTKDEEKDQDQNKTESNKTEALTKSSASDSTKEAEKTTQKADGSQSSNANKDTASSNKKTASTIILPTPGLSEAKEESDPIQIMKEPVAVYYASSDKDSKAYESAEMEALQQFIEDLPEVLLEETRGIYLVEDDLYDGAFSKEIGLAGTGGFSTSAEMEVFIKILTDEIPNYYNQLVNGNLVPYGSLELYKNNLYHELGHIMDYSEVNNSDSPARHLYSDSEELMAIYEGNPGLISEYGATTPHEFFAEATALYYMDPDLLESRSKELYDYIDDIYQEY